MFTKYSNSVSSKLLLLLMAFGSVIYSQSDNEIVVGRISPGEIDMSAFALTAPASINISGMGASYGEWDEETAFYGWILNSETRQVVWHLRNMNEFGEDEGLFEFSTSLQLPAGNYEVYYSGSVRNYIQVKGWGDFWSNVFGEHKYKASDRKKLFMTITGPEKNFSKLSARDLVDKKVKNSIVSIIRVGDYEDFKSSFTLTEETKIRVYSIGEGRKGSVYDFGWIYDENNHERIWTMSSWRSDHAGGGQKNIIVDKEISLKAGSYSVRFSTDDSHSFDEFNVLPPDDPQFWGITLWLVDNKDISNVKPFTDSERIEPIVEMIHVGDDEFRSQGFSLEKDMDVHVYSLGEGTSSTMVDYGWIINADTKETVWKMTGRKTGHGGGADKNRLFDDKIFLSKGNYIAYYTTDDSHSYDNWNATRPIESDRWGLTIWPTSKEDEKYVELFDEDEYKNENVIAEIIRVKDHKEIHKKFSLSENTKVRIIAIGEGDPDDMYDYGWIENENGGVVWDMTFRKTEHAGGAKKNRIFNDTIMLEKGSYYIYFVTDDSHSYNDWNATPPDNPELYGITLLFER
ncbi:MAG: hypothetical protein JW995_03960 [Melioribacteraceae bacterium]|nr:hypothetical protein [Melioribacteraceae bacterium]